MEKHFSIIGLGLIGGSMAKALRDTYPASYITAYDPHANTLKKAIDSGIINQGLSLFDAKKLAHAHVVFLCAPVQPCIEALDALAPYLTKETLVTDVCSTKGDLLRTVITLQKQYPDLNFVGGHPMAGKEKAGYSASTATLFQDAVYLLCPPAGADPAQVERLADLITAIGATPTPIDWQGHDHLLASISHLPHVIASALCNIAAQEEDESGTLARLAAGGFRDITRIASSSPSLWRSITMSNTQEVSGMITRMIDLLGTLRTALDEKNEQSIEAFFESGKKYRDHLQ